MFGFTIIRDREYQDLISDNQTLRDRVAYIESQLQSKTQDVTELGESIKGWEDQVSLLKKQCDLWKGCYANLKSDFERTESDRDQLKSASKTKSATIKFYSEKIVAINLELEEIRVCYKNLSDKNQKYVEEIINCRIEADAINKNLDRISTENQKHIDAIANHLAEKNRAEQLHNEATIELGLAKAKGQSYRLAVQVAADNLAIEVARIS
jgi:chromosome segregation ATPase